MLRRNLLTCAAPTALLLLTGCPSGSGAALTPAQVVADANGVVANLSAVVTNLLTANILPASVEAPLFANMEAAQKVLTGLSTAMAATSGATILQQVEADIEAVLTTLNGIPSIPAPYSTIIGAASVVLPIIEAFVQQYIPSATKPSAGTSSDRLVKARQTLGIAVLS